MNNIIRKAIILAAGSGTRTLPATKAVPKEMLAVYDKPAIQWIVEECIHAGISEVLIIINDNKVSIPLHFDNNPELEAVLHSKKKNHAYKKIHNIGKNIKISYSYINEPKGTGDAILKSSEFVGEEPFALLLGDDVVINDFTQQPAILELMNAYARFETTILGVKETIFEDIPLYASVDPKGAIDLRKSRDFEISNIVEKPKIQNVSCPYTSIGRYILTKDIFKALEKTKIDRFGELELVDAIHHLLKVDKEKVFAHIFAAKHYDIGNRVGLFEANLRLLLEDGKCKDRIIEIIKKSLTENGEDW